MAPTRASLENSEICWKDSPVRFIYHLVMAIPSTNSKTCTDFPDQTKNLSLFKCIPLIGIEVEIEFGAFSSWTILTLVALSWNAALFSEAQTFKMLSVRTETEVSFPQVSFFPSSDHSNCNGREERSKVAPFESWKDWEWFQSWFEPASWHRKVNLRRTDT